MAMYHYSGGRFFSGGIPLAVTTGRGSRQGEVPLHTHDFAELIFVAAGTTIHTIRFRHAPEVTGALVVGDVFAVNPGEAHSYKESRNVFYYNILFDPRFIADELEPLKDHPVYRELFAPGGQRNKIHLPYRDRLLFEQRIRLIREELPARRVGCREFVKALLLESIILLLRNNPVASSGVPGDYSGIASSIAAMEKSSGRKLSVPELARKAGMSQSLFYLRFRNATGMSPNQYLTVLRLGQACAMLRETGMTIAEIAIQCGFCDSNHFIKTFRMYHGVTPGDFRRQFSAAPPAVGGRLL